MLNGRTAAGESVLVVGQEVSEEFRKIGIITILGGTIPMVGNRCRDRSGVPLIGRQRICLRLCNSIQVRQDPVHLGIHLGLSARCQDLLQGEDDLGSSVRVHQVRGRKHAVMVFVGQVIAGILVRSLPVGQKRSRSGLEDHRVIQVSVVIVHQPLEGSVLGIGTEQFR